MSSGGNVCLKRYYTIESTFQTSDLPNYLSISKILLIQVQ
jgi:hypothetical protein